MEKHEQLDSGLYVPALSSGVEAQIKEMVESPMMQYLILNVFNAWAVNEGNYRNAWSSPVYAQLALIQETIMQGIDLIKKADGVPQSKRWAVTSMLARGVSLARLSCLSLDVGSFSDALSNYRMLLEREMTLKYLEANNQYEAFAQAFYAEVYQRASKGINDYDLRKSCSHEDLEKSKDLMKLIRSKYFDNKSPKLPGSYWKRPMFETLMDETVRKEALRVYDLGSGSVHPRLRDMIQPEESDISAEDLRSLILVTLGGIAMFGLSLFEESSPLVGEIDEIILQPPSGTSLLDMVRTALTSN